MDDYIPRSIAIAKLTKLEVTEPLATLADAKRLIADMPAADIAPIVHGEWQSGRFDDMTGDYEERCANCGKWSKEYDKPFCPNCGAQMDEVK